METSSKTSWGLKKEKSRGGLAQGRELSICCFVCLLFNWSQEGRHHGRVWIRRAPAESLPCCPPAPSAEGTRPCLLPCAPGAAAAPAPSPPPQPGAGAGNCWLGPGVVREGGSAEAGGCNHPSCCLFPQTNSRAIRVGEFKQRLSFPGTISPNENLIFFYRTLLH